MRFGKYCGLILMMWLSMAGCSLVEEDDGEEKDLALAVALSAESAPGFDLSGEWMMSMSYSIDDGGAKAVVDKRWDDVPLLIEQDGSLCTLNITDQSENEFYFDDEFDEKFEGEFALRISGKKLSFEDTITIDGDRYDVKINASFEDDGSLKGSWKFEYGNIEEIVTFTAVRYVALVPVKDWVFSVKRAFHEAITVNDVKIEAVDGGFLLTIKYPLPEGYEIADRKDDEIKLALVNNVLVGSFKEDDYQSTGYDIRYDIKLKLWESAGAPGVSDRLDGIWVMNVNGGDYKYSTTVTEVAKP